MEFKKGDIITAEFRVLVGGEERVVGANKCSPWKLVRRALDLDKPLRFAPGNPYRLQAKICSVHPSYRDGQLLVEYETQDGASTESRFSRFPISDLENIPEDEL